ncbi:MAG: DUF3137 domain-containing protein [Campylobacteraceae bacterium]
MKTIEEFEEFYNEKIKENLQTKDKEKIAKEKTYKIYFYIFVAILGLFFATLSVFHFEYTALFIISFLFISFIGKHFFKSLAKKPFLPIYKEALIKEIVGFIDEKLEYFPEKHISKDIFDKSSFNTVYDTYTGDDLVVGNINGVDIEFSEIKTEREEQKDDKKVTYVFHGVFFVANFYKNMEGSVKISPNNALRTFFSSILNVKHKKANMDLPEFEKHFDVYASDQILARYILSHSFMERVMVVYKNLKRPLFINIIDGKIYILAKYDTTLFEFVGDKMDDIKIAKEYFYIMSSFINIAEILKLDLDIFKK